MKIRMCIQAQGKVQLNSYHNEAPAQLIINREDLMGFSYVFIAVVMEMSIVSKRL